MAAEADSVLFDRRGGAAWITLNRPKMRNALDAATMRALAKTLRDAERSDARCVVLTGAGGNFCAGGDVTADTSDEGYYQYTATFADGSDAIAALTKPLIVRAEGRATAFGMALTCMADIAVATHDTVFGTPEITHGMFPMMAMGPIAAEMGRKAAWRLFYGGELISGDDAMALGILTEVAKDSADLDARIARWVERIEKADPRPLAVGRKLFNDLLDAPRSEEVRLGGKGVLRLLVLRRGTAPPLADYLKGDSQDSNKKG
jgi:enoyl-CoA hydratase/carnithine racemase